jgi:hypothetical protein
MRIEPRILSGGGMVNAVICHVARFGLFFILFFISVASSFKKYCFIKFTMWVQRVQHPLVNVMNVARALLIQRRT